MYELTNEQMSIMLGYWLTWTFRKDVLENISKETLEKLLNEFNEYELELESEIDAETMVYAWMQYFEMYNKLTPELAAKLESLL